MVPCHPFDILALFKNLWAFQAKAIKPGAFGWVGGGIRKIHDHGILCAILTLIGLEIYLVKNIFIGIHKVGLMA